MLLRFNQGIVVQVVKLHLAVAQHAGRAQQGNQAFFALGRIQKSCHDFKVMYHPDIHAVIGHLGHGLDNGGRPFIVSTLGGADPIAEGHPCVASVGRGTCHLPKGRVVGNGQGPMAQD